jgi:hypothetical protein
MAMTETSAVRYRFTDMFNIAGPSCALPARLKKTFDNGVAAKRSRPSLFACLSPALPPGFEEAGDRNAI